MKSFQAVILAAILLLQSYSTSMSYSYSGKGGKSGGGKGGKSGSKGGKSDSKATKATKTPKVSKSGGGGGCAWPLDQFLCWEIQANLAIKYTVCPTAGQVGNAVVKVYNDETFLLKMSEYISPTAYRDTFGSEVVLVDDVTVKYGPNIYSPTNC